MTRPAHITQFARSQDGGALVEFGLLLPTLMLILGLIVEGGRTFWSYQTTVTGVRDATRFLSRVVQSDACTDGAGQTNEWDGDLARIVRESQGGESLFPSGVSVQSVTSQMTCVAGDFRNATAPVASVTATLRIEYPFAGLFGLVGLDATPVITDVTDTTRIVGS